MLNVEAAIRKRAYEIWQAEGQVHGNELSHSLRAQEEIVRPEASNTRLPRGTQAKHRTRTTVKSARP
jgi:hypothetical protein